MEVLKKIEIPIFFGCDKTMMSQHCFFLLPWGKKIAERFFQFRRKIFKLKKLQIKKQNAKPLH